MPLTLQQAEPIKEKYQELVGITFTFQNRSFRNDSVLIVPESKIQRPIFFKHYESPSNHQEALNISGWKASDEVEIIVLQRDIANHKKRHITLNNYLDANGKDKAY